MPAFDDPTQNPLLTQDGQKADHIPVYFGLGDNPLDRANRGIHGQSFLNGPLTLVSPRGKIVAGTNGLVIAANGDSELWTDVATNDRVGLVDSRIEWQNKDQSEIENAKIELTRPSANNLRLRLTSPRLNGSAKRAFLRVDTNTSSHDVIELRTGNSDSTDDTKVHLQNNLVKVEGTQQVDLRNYKSGAEFAYLLMGQASTDIQSGQAGGSTALNLNPSGGDVTVGGHKINGAALGRLGTTTRTSNSPAFTGSVSYPNSVTVTTLANRKIRVRVHANVLCATADEHISIGIANNVGTILNQAYRRVHNNFIEQISVELETTSGAGGSVTYQISAFSGGTSSVIAASSSSVTYITVYDEGAV